MDQNQRKIIKKYINPAKKPILKLVFNVDFVRVGLAVKCLRAKNSGISPIQAIHPKPPLIIQIELKSHPGYAKDSNRPLSAARAW